MVMNERQAGNIGQLLLGLVIDVIGPDLDWYAL
jgi:hypothetical protein